MDDLQSRSAEEVLDDHLNIAQKWEGGEIDVATVVQEDLRRNVAEDIVILTNRGTFHGHEGVMQLAEMLGEELPEHEAFQYTYTSVRAGWPSSNGHMRTPPRASGTAPTPT